MLFFFVWIVKLQFGNHRCSQGVHVLIGATEGSMRKSFSDSISNHIQLSFHTETSMLYSEFSVVQVLRRSSWSTRRTGETKQKREEEEEEVKCVENVEIVWKSEAPWMISVTMYNIRAFLL